MNKEVRHYKGVPEAYNDVVFLGNGTLKLEIVASQGGPTMEINCYSFSDTTQSPITFDDPFGEVFGYINLSQKLSPYGIWDASLLINKDTVKFGFLIDNDAFIEENNEFMLKCSNEEYSLLSIELDQEIEFKKEVIDYNVLDNRENLESFPKSEVCNKFLDKVEEYCDPLIQKLIAFNKDSTNLKSFNYWINFYPEFYDNLINIAPVKCYVSGVLNINFLVNEFPK